MGQSTRQSAVDPDPAENSSGSLTAHVTSILADYEGVCGAPAPGAFCEEGWSLELPPGPGKELFAEHRRKGWDRSREARCNFEYRPRITPRAGLWVLSLWQKSLMGRTLTEIKADPGEIAHFAEEVSAFLTKVLGPGLPRGHWCICTTPKRRHKERNFATLICEEIHRRLEIPFYEDVAYCRSRQRINAEFTLNQLPREPNVIVFDDFVTTGSTLKGMRELLLPHGKTLLFVAGINNNL